MANIIEIKNLSAPGLAMFAHLTEPQLRCRLEPEKGIFIAEGKKIIQLALASGFSLLLDQAGDRLMARLAHPVAEAEGRIIAQQMALLLQAALLVRYGPPAVAEAFLATRLASGAPALFGALPTGLDLDTILHRHPPP